MRRDVARRSRRATLCATLTCLVVAAAGCDEKGPSNDKNHPQTRVVHGDGDGPLSASSGAGGNSVTAPTSETWTATFGGLLLCSTDPGTAIEIEGVRYSVRPEALAPRTRLRTVPAVSAREHSDRLEWAPVYSARGSYPHLEGLRLGGTFTTALRQSITQPCDGPDGVLHRFTELVTELRVDRRGGVVDATFFDYRAGGKPFTLKISWQMIACGSLTPKHCP